VEHAEIRFTGILTILTTGEQDYPSGGTVAWRIHGP